MYIFLDKFDSRSIVTRQIDHYWDVSKWDSISMLIPMRVKIERDEQRFICKLGFVFDRSKNKSESMWTYAKWFREVETDRRQSTFYNSGTT